MRLVLDTNILVSALLVEKSLPARLIVHWRHGLFDLLTSAVQIDELMRVTRYPKIRERLSPPLAGRLVNDLRQLAILVEKLPKIAVASDPDDDHLLALAAAGRADFLVTGDRRHLLHLERYENTPIVTVRDFLGLTGRLS